jgi:WD40-like Beta Propeller Repeat
MLVCGVAASSAHADSLVYMKGGNVWISHGDGSSARQVTGGPNTWSWPTQDDAGHILVAGGAGGISAGMEDTPGSEIYRMDQQGHSLSDPQSTPGSFSTVNCPTFPPQSLRVAPDGRHFAYFSQWACIGAVTEGGTVGGPDFTDAESMTDFSFPYWVDNGNYVVTRDGDQLGDCNTTNGFNCEWWVRDFGDPSGAGFGYPWFTDTGAAASTTGFEGLAVSRDKTKFVSLEDDGADHGGAAQDVELRFWSVPAVPTSANDGDVGTGPTYKCQINLPADPNSTLWYYDAGPTFSPDGTKLAFAEPDGIHIANVAALSSTCPSAPLVIPGGTQPFWSAADESPSAGYVPPPSPPAQPTPSKPAPDTTPPVLSTLAVTPKRFAVSSKRTAVSAKAKKGAAIRYVLSEPARVSLKIELVTKKKRKVVLKSKGTLVRSGQSGANALAFSGRIGSKKLSAGSYEIVATAVDAAGNRTAKPKTATFTIVRR